MWLAMHCAISASRQSWQRLSVSFSRNMDNLRAAVALAIVAYNFVRVHRSFENDARDGGGSNG